MNTQQIYKYAKEKYAQFGIDTEKAMNAAAKIPVSLQCWQGDDGIGLENRQDAINTGIMATGNFPGRARTADELRSDAQLAFSLIPGKHKFNLHSMYAETNGKKVERNELEYGYYKNWIDWAKSQKIGLDFNPTIYNHPNMPQGYSLSSPDKSVRAFWIEHAKRCRSIAYEMGKELGQTCVNNLWISDGSKDNCADKLALRQNLKDSLDEIFKEKFDKNVLADALEPKLFGVGTESFVVGSMEFYLGYALANQLILCLDTGHFHPTELVSEKISALLLYCKKLLLHVSRGVRWDSDHVVLWNDETQAIFSEIKRADAYKRVHIALDFFDASINRVSAWVIGARNAQKAILYSLLEPTSLLLNAEKEGDFGTRLALCEEFKTLPFAAVWDMYCEKQNVPTGDSWIKDVKAYEKLINNSRA